MEVEKIVGCGHSGSVFRPPLRPSPRGRVTVTQRGNRRERLFFADADSESYRALLREAWAREGSRYGACRMPNPVQLILAPKTPEGLGRALGHRNTKPAGHNDAAIRPARTAPYKAVPSRLYGILGQVFESWHAFSCPHC
jgi:hypothetical protein